MIRTIAIAGLVSLASSCGLPTRETSMPEVSVEVNQRANEFRIAIKGEPSVSIIGWQLTAPSKSLPPRSASVLARTDDGRIVGCGRDNKPRRAASAFSSSTPASQITFEKLPPEGQFRTRWFRVEDLFFLFDDCVLPSRRGRYVEYKIIVEVESSLGEITSETQWIPIVGFDPSGQAVGLID